MIYEQQRDRGLYWEERVVEWMKANGWAVSWASRAGSRIEVADRSPIVSPDLQCYSEDRIIWLEVKSSTMTPELYKWEWRGKLGTGIERHYWLDYCDAAEETRLDTYIIFVHEDRRRARLDAVESLAEYSLGHVPGKDKRGNDKVWQYFPFEEIPIACDVEDIKAARAGTLPAVLLPTDSARFDHVFGKPATECHVPF